MTSQNLRKLFAAIALASGMLALSACSSTGTGANASGADQSGADANGVQTSGLGDGSDANGNGLSNPNAMIPGANQKYYFDFDKSDVHSSDLPSIGVQANYLNSHPNAHAKVEGNTDIRGSREYNIALGQRRANAVANILKLKGVKSSQVSTISYGAEKPVARGNTETDYAQNRRDDMIYDSHN